jgi:hypothetical protein
MFFSLKLKIQFELNEKKTKDVLSQNFSKEILNVCIKKKKNYS